MTTWQSAVYGIRTSGDYFLSTFMFGVMFGIAASAAGLAGWQALLMGAASFSASASFAALEFWQAPLPLGTIALSVFLVSTRNILLGMSMTYHFDGHSLRRRIVWLYLLNDPGVVTSFRQPDEVDRLGYVTGYGVSMMVSWLLSISIGLNASLLFSTLDLGKVGFAGPLVHIVFASVWAYHIGMAHLKRRGVMRATLLWLALTAGLHGVYDFIVLGFPSSALVLAALVIVGVWVWRLTLIRRLSDEGARSTSPD